MSETKKKAGAKTSAAKAGVPAAFNFFTLFSLIFENGLKDLLNSLVEVKEALKAAQENVDKAGKELNTLVARQTAATKAAEAGLKVDGAPTDEELSAAADSLLEAEVAVKTQEAALVAAQESIKEAFAPFDALFAQLGLQASGFWKGSRTLRLVATSAKEAAELHKELREAGVEVKDLRGGVELTFTVKL